MIAKKAHRRFTRAAGYFAGNGGQGRDRP
jgi:hypothetical protein